MATSTVTTFAKQGTTAVNSGSIMTCFRQNNSGASGTGDLGGGGSGSDYANTICVRFADLPDRVSSASIVLTFRSWAYKAALTMYVQGCSDVSSSHNGTNLPTMYGSAATGSIPDSSYTSTALDVTAQVNAALANGSKCLYISANKASNRKTNCSSIVLTYTSGVYEINYNANGGSGTLQPQNKLYNVNLTVRNNSFTSPASGTQAGYKVTFNANGGSCSTSSLTAQDSFSYSFSNWNTNSNGTGTSYNAGGTYSANSAATLYAIWTKNITRGNVTLPTPSRTGYTFAGWGTSSTSTSGSTGSYTPSGNITLYAVWQIITYDVSFNLAGGYGVSDFTYNCANSYVLGTPSKTGYSFVGWTGSNGTTAQTNVTISTGSTGNKAYTANWTPITYTISYNKNSTSASGTTASSNHTYDSSKNLTANGFTRTGYTFLGWHTNSSATTAAYTNQQSVKNLTTTSGATITLYAIWRVNTYTITFNANGGTSAPAAQEYTYASSGNLTLSSTKPTKANENLSSYIVTLNANGGNSPQTNLEATRTASYTFSSWNTAADGSGSSYTTSFPLTIANDTTLYAQYTSSVATASVNLPTATKSSSSVTGYTVTLNAKGGSNVPADIVSTRTASYTFRGWSTNSSATTGTTGSYTPSANVVLYAIWSTTYQNESIALPVPTKTGSTFVGWSTVDGSTAYIQTEPYTPTANITLYAIWGSASGVYYAKIRLYTVRNNAWKPVVLYRGDSSNKPKLLIEE